VADAVLAVPVTNHSAQNGNGKLAAFAKAHSWKKWTAVNDEALRGIANARNAEEYRFWAIVLLETWGNPNDPRVRPEDDDGNPKGVTDYSRQLRVSKQTVSRWGKLLAAENLLHVLPDGIYPVDDPSKPFPKVVQERGTKKGMKGEDWRRFGAVWESEYSEKANREAQLRADLKAVSDEKKALFKAWRASQERGTNEPDCPALPSEPVPDSSENRPTLRERIYKEEDLEVNIRGVSEFEQGGLPAPSSSSETGRANTQTSKPFQEEESPPPDHWFDFVLLTKKAGMDMTAAEMQSCETLFRDLEFAEQIKAAVGIQVRIESREYDPDDHERRRYIPTVRNYLLGQLWQRPLRGAPPGKRKVDTSALDAWAAEGGEA
jgi:hypothetical protein